MLPLSPEAPHVPLATPGTASMGMASELSKHAQAHNEASVRAAPSPLASSTPPRRPQTPHGDQPEESTPNIGPLFF